MFVSFRPANGGFASSLVVGDYGSITDKTELTLSKSEQIYQWHIEELKSALSEIQDYRNSRKLIPARKVWQVGHLVHQLKDRMQDIGLEIDSLYDHLIRDLKVNRKWLEKAIILRRYIPRIEIIPRPLNWGQLEKGTRRKSIELLGDALGRVKDKGVSLDDVE